MAQIGVNRYGTMLENYLTPKGFMIAWLKGDSVPETNELLDYDSSFETLLLQA